MKNHMMVNGRLLQTNKKRILLLCLIILVVVAGIQIKCGYDKYQKAPMAVHLALLSAGVILLEGICLAMVLEGIYFLNAAPLNLADADGAPCRAVLIDKFR